MRALNSIRNLTKTTLSNGVTVVTNPSSSSVAVVGAVSGCGSRNETASSQTTINRSVTLNNLAANGTNVNSYVDRERSGVFGTTVPGNAAAFAENLVAAVSADAVSDADRAHALAALNAVSADKETVCEDYAHMSGYMLSGLSASPYGTTSGINETSAEDVLSFRREALAGSNLTIVGTGDVSHDQLCAIAGQIATNTGRVAVNEACQFHGNQLKDRNDFEEDCWFRLGFYVPGSDRPRETAVFQVLAQVAGEYNNAIQHAQHSSNPLMKFYSAERPIRRVEEAGHTRHLNSEDIVSFKGKLTSHSDCGLFGMYAHVPKAYAGAHGYIEIATRGMGVLYQMQREMKRMWKGLKDHEIEAAKNKAILKLYQKYSNPTNEADLISQGASLKTITSNIARVSKNDIEAAVDKYMYDADFVQATYGACDGFDAASNRMRSRNLLKGGLGLEVGNKQHY